MRPLQYRDVTKEQLVNRIDDLATIIEAKEKQIEALVAAMEEIRDMTVCDVLGLRYSRARQTAIIAIKEATNAS